MFVRQDEPFELVPVFPSTVSLNDFNGVGSASRGGGLEDGRGARVGVDEVTRGGVDLIGAEVTSSGCILASSGGKDEGGRGGGSYGISSKVVGIGV